MHHGVVRETRLAHVVVHIANDLLMIQGGFTLYREHTIFWLYAEQSSETDLLELLDSDDNSSGISQIPTQCLPG